MKHLETTSDKRRDGRVRAVTVGYLHTFMGPQLRPNGRMPISAHREVGRLLQSVWRAAQRRAGARNPVDSIRSELDEWAMREHSPDELDQETLFQLYYGERGLTIEVDRKEMIGQIDTATDILIRHYPDCPPLRELLRLAGKAKQSICSWKS